MKHICLTRGKAIATLLLLATHVLGQTGEEKLGIPSLVELRSLIGQGLFRIYKQHYGYQQDIDGKIFVINFASDPELFKEFLSTDYAQGGRVAADGLAAIIKKEFGKAEGDIGMLIPVPTAGSLGQRVKGFQDEISAKYPDLKLAFKEVSDGHATPAWNAMSDLIATKPKLRGVFAPSLTVAQGAAQAIVDNNAFEKIILVGFDSEDKPVKLVKQKSLSNSFKIQRQKKGDTASGVVVERMDPAITLDVTPCSSEKETITFVKPYKETQISDITCKDKTFEQSQVIQQ